jgi:replicative DNA helicase
MLDNTAFDRAIEVIGPDDFYRDAHRKIMRAIIELSERHEPVDLVTLADALRGRNELQDIGGASYLAELAERVPTAANVAYYARIVKDKAILRALIETEHRDRDAQLRSAGAGRAFLDEAEHRSSRSPSAKTRPSFFRVRDIVIESMKAVEQLYERQELVTGVPADSSDLDKKTAGLQPAI